MSNGGDVIKIPWDSEAWERAIMQRTDVGRIGCRGDWVMYTPGRLLVDSLAAENEDVQGELRRSYATQCEEPAAEIAASLGLTLFTMPDDRLVATIRAIRAIVPGSASLEHIWLPGPNSGHGDTPPAPTSDPGGFAASKAAGDGPTVYVLDTGIADTVPFAVESRPGIDAEIPSTDGENRDHAAGHGTHVAGLVARCAGQARIVARRLLETPVGMAGELDTAQAIADAGREGADIINCSLGGTTLFDAPPLATERALAALPPGTVVVASAGNSGEERPHWPAASKHAIAVGSVHRKDGGDWLRADFSNYGYWVDCCAPGVDIPSTFLYWDGGDDEPVFKGFATWTGTSFSCPQVVAAIAALAVRDGIEPSLAAYRLVDDPARRRIESLGAFVDPDDLP